MQLGRNARARADKERSKFAFMTLKCRSSSGSFATLMRVQSRVTFAMEIKSIRDQMRLLVLLASVPKVVRNFACLRKHQ